MEEKKIESGFIIQNIVLLESNFSRVNNVSFDKTDIRNHINVDVHVDVNEKIVTVHETVTLKQTYKEQEQVSLNVKMVGIFEKQGETLIKNLDEFGRINGAAIIFPYIREHITNLSFKAGLGAVLLPPMNFTANKKDQ